MEILTWSNHGRLRSSEGEGSVDSSVKQFQAKPISIHPCSLEKATPDSIARCLRHVSSVVALEAVETSRKPRVEGLRYRNDVTQEAKTTGCQWV